MEMISSVHFGVNFDNAFWNGSQMVYGDGSGRILAVGSLTKDIAVMAHEMTHGVTQYTAALRYSKQSGALNESFSDVVGSMVKQWVKGQKVAEADWLMGQGLYVRKKGARRRAVRSLKAPGTAHNDPTPGGIGIDPQVAHMSEYLKLPDDEDQGGVHLNSGIANRAFYLAATRLGGYSWEGAGQIWYRVLAERRIRPAATFADMRDATVRAATELFGDRAARTVAHAWAKVGVNGAPA
jgi:Zn-dependent metalloprotease